MARETTQDLTTSDAAASSSGWIPLNTHQENFNIGFAIRKSGVGVAPVINLEGTMFDLGVDSSVATTRIFALVSSVATSSVGTNVAGQITFPIAAIRVSTISGGSGASTLTLSVIEAGKH